VTAARNRNATFLHFFLVATCLQSVQAGPPYVTDDPEPTDTHQFENYFYVQGTRAAGSFADPGVGIEINYGAFANTQLSWSIPLNLNPGPGGMGQVWAPFGGGIKYRFVQEDSEGWRPQVAVFPQIFIPIGSAAHSNPITELLPIWLQKSFGPWMAFGGGGYTRNPGSNNRNFAVYGWALQRQISHKLELGVELFGQTHDAAEDHGSTAAGFAALYDLDETWHLIGSVNTSIAGARESDKFSYNLALKWTH
jgi:hypothetical protein